MLEVWQDGNDLVLVSERCDKWAHCFLVSQIVEKLEFIEDADRATCHVDLLDCDIARFPGLGSRGLTSRRVPLYAFFLVDIPIVLVLIVVEIFCLVHGRECA